MKQLRKYSLITLLGGLCIFLFSVISGGECLKSIQVSYTGSGKEHQDKYVFGVNSDEKPPDYGLEVRFDDEWMLIGLYSNTFMGTNALSFTPNKRIPVRLLEQIRLYDADPLENDVLEVHTIKPGQIQGENYAFEVAYGYSLLAGVAYYWHTAIGKAILLGITVCVVLFFLSAGVF
jgi:hypothetical protein